MTKSNIGLYVEDTAKKKIRDLIKKKSNGMFFRIYIVGGGCSGFQYGFDFDKKSDDDFIESDDIIIDSMSAQYLNNAGLYFSLGSLTNNLQIFKISLLSVIDMAVCN